MKAINWMAMMLLCRRAVHLLHYGGGMPSQDGHCHKEMEIRPPVPDPSFSARSSTARYYRPGVSMRDRHGVSPTMVLVLPDARPQRLPQALHVHKRQLPLSIRPPPTNPAPPIPQQTRQNKPHLPCQTPPHHDAPDKDKNSGGKMM